MVPGTLLSEIKVARILIQDRDGKGSTSAYLCWIANALLQRRQIAFDGRQWWIQANNRSPFKPIGEGEVPLPTKEAMEKFITKRREQQAGS